MKKSAQHLIASLLFITLLIGSVMLQGNWLDLKKVQAETKGGRSGTANTLSSGNDEKSDVANDADGNFVVTWQSNGEEGDPDSNGEGVYFQLFNNFGEKQLPTPGTATDQLVNSGHTNGNQSNPAVAMDANGNFVIVWSDNNGGIPINYDVYAQAYTKSGAPIGSAVKINSMDNKITPLADISIDFNGPASGSQTDFVVVWQYSADGEFLTSNDIHMRRMQVDFIQRFEPTFTSDELTVGTDTERNQDKPQVAMNTDGEFIVTWSGASSTHRTDQIWYQAYDSEGNHVGESTQVNSTNVTGIATPHIASDKKDRTRFDDTERNYVIVYQGDTVDDASGIFARQVNCSDADPENGSDAELTCSLNSVELNVNSSTTGAQVAPDVSADYLGNFTVVWEDQNTGGGSGKNIYAQSYRYNDGMPYGAMARFGTQFGVNTSILDETDPAITMNQDGAYVITFSNSLDGSSTDVVYQEYISDLYKDGVETLANSSDSVTQTEVDVAVSPDGKYAAVWHGLDPNGIYFTLWDEDGNTIVQDVRIDNDGAINDDANPTISFYKDTSGDNVGRFVIAWSQSVPNCGTDYANSGTDIWYREVTAEGTPVGTCERKAHPVTENDGTDSYPQISAGYYNNDGGPVENNFAIIYTHREGSEDFIKSTFHNGTPGFLTILSDFTVNTLSNACTECNSVKGVAINPTNNRIVYAWSEEDIAPDNGIFIREASMGTLLGESPQQINPLIGDREINSQEPAVAWLPNNQFMVTYTEYPDSSIGIIRGARYEFDGSDGRANEIDPPFGISPQTADFKMGNDIASDLESGTFLSVWANSPVSPSPVNKILGQLYKYEGPEIGKLKKFGSIFTINSTKKDERILPSADMNTTGKMVIGWEGNFQDNVGFVDAGSDDVEGATLQALLNPLYAEAYPELQPEIRQEISGGGRTLNVPDSMEFPETIVTNPDEAVIVEVSVRNNTLPDPDPIQYIEFEDLEGAPAVITVSAENFVRTSDNQSYIPVTNFSVKNCDQDLASSEECKMTINGDPDDLSIDNVETADNDSDTDTYYEFGSEVEQKTLATKAGNNLGKWRIFPKFKLEIPPTTPPGNHTTVITFSLT